MKWRKKSPEENNRKSKDEDMKARREDFYKEPDDPGRKYHVPLRPADTIKKSNSEEETQKNDTNGRPAMEHKQGTINLNIQKEQSANSNVQLSERDSLEDNLSTIKVPSKQDVSLDGLYQEAQGGYIGFSGLSGDGSLIEAGTNDSQQSVSRSVQRPNPTTSGSGYNNTEEKEYAFLPTSGIEAQEKDKESIPNPNKSAKPPPLRRKVGIYCKSDGFRGMLQREEAERISNAKNKGERTL